MLGGEINQLLVRIAADNSRLRGDLDKAKSQFTGFADDIRRKLKGIAAGFGAGFLIREFAQAADTMALLSARLRLVTSSTEDFNKARQDAYRISQQNNVGLQETVQLYTKLAEPIKRLGGTTQEVSAVVEAFASSLRVGGASAQEASAATLQFAQAMASGKLYGDEFRSLAEASPRFMKALADGMGVPIERLKEMSTQGKLTADVVGNALIKSLGTLRAEAAQLPDTVGGALQRVRNDALLMAEKIDEATGASRSMAEVLGGVAGIVTEFNVAVDAASKELQTVNAEFDMVSTAIGGIGVVLETLTVLFANVGYVAKTTATEIAVMYQQAKLYLTGQFTEAKRIGDEWTAQAEANRRAIDKFSDGIVGATERMLQQRQAQRLLAASSGEAAGKFRELASGAAGAAAAQAAAKKAAEDYAKASQLIADLTAKTLGVSSDYVAKLRLLELWYSRNTDKTDEYRTAVEALIAAQESSQQIAKKQAEEEQKIAKALADAAAERAKSLQAYGDETNKINEKVRALEMEAAQLGLTTEAQAALVIELRNAEIARLQSLATSDMVLLAGQEEIDSINARIEALRRLNNAEADLAAKGAMTDAAKRTREQWTSAANQIEQALTDAMVQGFSGGRSIAKSVGDWIANYFKTTVARTIAQALTGAFSLSLPGMAGASGGAAGGAAGGLGSIGNLLSLGGSIFGGVGAGGLMGGVASGLSGAGSIGSVLGLLQGGTASSIAAGIGQGVGMAVPYLGIAIGIYALADKIRKNGGSPALQNFSYLDSAGGMAGSPWATPNLQSRSAYDDVLTPIIGNVAALAKALGGSTGSLTYGLMSSVSPDGKGGQVVAEVADAIGKRLFVYNQNGDNATVQQRLEEQIPRLLLAGLQGANLPERFAEYFRSIDVASATKEQVEAAVQTAQTAAEVAELIGNVGDASVEALAGIAQLAGGLQNLAANIGTFYQEFYSQAERETMLRKQMTEALAAVNVQLPKSRAEFRALVESQDLTTESGRQTYTTLLQVAGAFAQLNPEVEALAEAMRSAADIAAERADLERRLLEVMGDTAALRELEIKALDPSNQALLRHIYALEDEAKAAAAAADEVARVSAERGGLEVRLLRTLGDTAALRDLELAALDESNRELLQRIFALEDEAAAARAAADELARVTSEIERVSAERYGLETRLLQAQGETARLREMELAALDGSNRALLRQIYLIEDWKRATQQAAQAAADVAREQISALQPLVGFIKSAVDDLMGGGGLGMSAAQGRQFVSQAARTALTTGYLPEQEALQKAVQAAQGDFGMFATRADEQRARIQLARQLEAIGDVAGGQLSDAEKQLNVANEQLKQLQEINAGLRKLSEFGDGTTSGPGGRGGRGSPLSPTFNLEDYPITIGPVDSIEVGGQETANAVTEALANSADGLKRYPWDPFRPLAHLMGEGGGEQIPFDPFNPLAHLIGRKPPEQTDMEKLIERVEILSSDTRKIRRQLSRTRALTEKGEAIRVTTQTELT